MEKVKEPIREVAKPEFQSQLQLSPTQPLHVDFPPQPQHLQPPGSVLAADASPSAVLDDGLPAPRAKRSVPPVEHDAPAAKVRVVVF